MILPLRVLLAQLRMRRLELVPDDRALVGNLNARLEDQPADRQRPAETDEGVARPLRALRGESQ